jgi:hypothetical protein
MAKTLLLNVLLKILGMHLMILMKSIHSDMMVMMIIMMILLYRGIHRAK